MTRCVRCHRCVRCLPFLHCCVKVLRELRAGLASVACPLLLGLAFVASRSAILERRFCRIRDRIPPFVPKSVLLFPAVIPERRKLLRDLSQIQCFSQRSRIPSAIAAARPRTPAMVKENFCQLAWFGFDGRGALAGPGSGLWAFHRLRRCWQVAYRPAPMKS